MTRVVVTGMGWITPLGNDLDTVWKRMCNGESAIALIERFDASSFPTKFAGQVAPHLSPVRKKMDPSTSPTGGVKGCKTSRLSGS